MRKEILAKALSGNPLAYDEALDAGRDLAEGRPDAVSTAAFLAALAARGERADELAGLAAAFREAGAPFPAHPEALDTCGTGGDGHRTFNLSTAAALLVASLGVPVAKHGNRSVSSACGSADLLERAGFPIEEAPEAAARRLDERGFAFLFAPRYHPAMAHVAPVRKALGLRTVFNLLGPLLNPAGVRRQVVGVYAPDRMELMATALARLGAERAAVVHGAGGYDEVVLHGPVLAIEVRDGATQTHVLNAESFGLPQGRPEDLSGGSPEANVRMLHLVLEGRGPRPLASAVAANAALALRTAGACEDLRDGASAAMEALRRGRAGAYLRTLLAPDTNEEALREHVS